MTDDARTAILRRIRDALATTAPPIPSEDTAYRRRSVLDREALVTAFTARAQGYKVLVERTRRAAARAAVAGRLTARGHTRIALPAGLAADLVPEGFDLVADTPDLDNAAIAACDGVLTSCACAIAETGTLVLDHGPGQGRRKLTLLPDYHLCLVMAETIVGLVPEAVERMAPAVKAGRPLTFVSGPSATSDIELSRVEGVHGPRTLDVLIIDP